jgi:hypothetical protein
MSTENVVKSVDQNVVDQNGESRQDYPWKKSKKVAVLISFSGKDYHGMQRWGKNWENKTENYFIH